MLQLNSGWEQTEAKFVDVARALLPLGEVSLEISTAEVLYSARMQLRTVSRSTESAFGQHELHKRLVDLLQRITDREAQLSNQ